MLALRDEDDITYEYVFDIGKPKEKTAPAKREEDYTEEDLIKVILDRLDKNESIIKLKEEFSIKKINDRIIDSAFMKVVQVRYYLLLFII